MTKKPKIIAHRGASKDAPENTIAAIKKALSLNVHCVEIDVRLSKDGVPIVLHDDSTARMTGVKNTPTIDQLTLTEIQQLDVGKLFDKAFIGEKIPTLLDVLNLEWRQIGLMIEIKECPQPAKTLVQAIFNEIVKVKTLLPPLIFGSFSLEIIKEVQSHISHLNSSYGIIGIIEEPEMIEAFLVIGLKRLAIWYKLITQELLLQLNENGIEVWAFTVDDLPTAQFLISFGVNGIITNDPKDIK